MIGDKATARPWRTTGSSIHAGDTIAEPSVMVATLHEEEFHRDGTTMCAAPTHEEMEANAALIVLTVNHIEPLVEACRKLSHIVEEGRDFMSGETKAQADRALAAADEALAQFLPSGEE